eukprot:snap_masked-scaffold_6-processed-gene-11.32-mRNA-1 protein AED:1.00 eAED:1.00 QI:0/-1/0/0/-1/1/1/0/255
MKKKIFKEESKLIDGFLHNFQSTIEKARLSEEKLRESETRFNYLQAALTNLIKIQEKRENQMASLSKSQEELKEKISKQENELSHLAEKVQESDAKMLELHQTLEVQVELNESLVRLGNAPSGKYKAACLEQEIDDLKARMERLKTKVQNKLSHQEQKLASFDSKFEHQKFENESKSKKLAHEKKEVSSTLTPLSHGKRQESDVLRANRKRVAELEKKWALERKESERLLSDSLKRHTARSSLPPPPPFPPEPAN